MKRKIILILFIVMLYSCKDSEKKQYEITYIKGDKDTVSLYTFYRFKNGCIYEVNENASVCGVQSIKEINE